MWSINWLFMQAKLLWSMFRPSRSELVNTRFPNSLTVKLDSPQALVPMETTQQWLFKLWSSASRVCFLGHLIIKRGYVFNKTFSANFTVRMYPFTIVKVVQNISLPSSIIPKKLKLASPSRISSILESSAPLLHSYNILTGEPPQLKLAVEVTHRYCDQLIVTDICYRPWRKRGL